MIQFNVLLKVREFGNQLNWIVQIEGSY